MARPQLSIKPWSVAQSLNSSGVIDMTALTSPGGVFLHRTGVNGADWTTVRSFGTNGGNPALPENFFLNQFGEKGTGTSQLTPRPFAPPGQTLYSTANQYLTPTWVSDDKRRDYGYDTDDGNYGAVISIPDGVVDCGIEVPGIVAKVGEERTAYFLWRVNSGTFVASASVNDGSSPSVSLSPIHAPRDTNTEVSFAVTYTPGPDADALVRVELRMTESIATYTRSMSPQVAYIPVPRKLPASRAHIDYMRAQGAFGGSRV